MVGEDLDALGEVPVEGAYLSDPITFRVELLNVLKMLLYFWFVNFIRGGGFTQLKVFLSGFTEVVTAYDA